MFPAGGDDDALAKARKASIAAGVIFGIAWWVYIDGAAYGNCYKRDAAGDCVADSVASKAAGYHWLPGLGVTIAFIMINGMKWEELSGDSLGGDDSAIASKARCWLIAAMLIGLGCIAAALFIMVEVFVRGDSLTEWTGISVFVQCLLIFLSAWVMRFGNTPDGGF
mmetsp:Transcript_28183/g.78904  ORF Transcript_28183/g.78904 Transcript_28183/m.78904 type:complete len:166 (-) Transcript_28183:121-618(-)